MDFEQLNRLIRENYPFPIAHAHKKTLGVLQSDDELRKLKCICETAETIVRFVALLAVAQVRQDVFQHHAPDQNALKKAINLKNPTFGRWQHLPQGIMNAYRDARDRLVVPELFGICFQESSDGTLLVHPVQTDIITPLRDLRNTFTHDGFPESQLQTKVAEGLELLDQLLEALQFLAHYQLSFTQKITVDLDAHQHNHYTHDLTVFNGCFSPFGKGHWHSEINLKSGIVVLLRDGKFLTLDPFLIFTDQYHHVPDLFVLNNFTEGKPVYISSQLGEKLSLENAEWTDGRRHQDTLREFFKRLRDVPQPSPPTPVLQTPSPTTVPQASPLAEPSVDESPLSIAEIFDRKYRVADSGVQHKSPYKFLDYYNPEDHDIFFGRDKEIRILQQKFYNSRLLVLHGQSGTGKTSLIRAGLIPRLDQESYIPVYVRVLKEPLREIKRELIRQLGLDDSSRSESFSETLQISLAELLRQMTERVSKTVIIVLDQFEEFFLRFPEEVRQQFEAELAACVETPLLDVKFLISLRSDYFSYLATFEDSIPHIFTHQLQLERFPEAQALEAVIKPAERLGIQVNEAMVQIKLLPELLSEEGTIEPPFLQIVCDALYQYAQSEGRSEIGMIDYEAIGDVKGCLMKYVDTKLRQFGKKQGIARTVLKALVTAEGTKRASFVEELFSRMKSTANVPVLSPVLSEVEGKVEGTVCNSEEELKTEYLDKFVRDRLVRVEDVEGEARYELSHEYLVTHIGDWIEENEREVTKVLEVIDRAYEAYQSTGLLVESKALQMIKPYEEQLILSHAKHAFIQRSKTQVRKKWRGLLMRVGVLLLFAGSVVGAILGYQIYQVYLESERQRKIALSQQLETEEQRKIAEELSEIVKKNLLKSDINPIEVLNRTSKALFLSHDELGALFAGLKAGIYSKQTNVSDTLKNQILINLRKIVHGVREKNRLEGHEDSVESVAFSPDGTLLASGGNDKTIRLWKVVNGKEINILHGHSEPVLSVAFSPDGTLLASKSGGTAVQNRDVIKLWKVADGRELTTLHGHSHWISSINFSPDGTIFASGSYDKTIKLWNVPDGKELMTLHGHSEAVLSITFSLNGKMLASGSHGGTIKLWNIENGKEIRTLRHSSPVVSIDFSPDSTMLVSAGDKTIRFWKISNGMEIRTLQGYSERATMTINFSPDGKILASGGFDKIIRLWDWANGKEIRLLQGHTGSINSISFSPDGTTLASGGADKTIRLWKMEEGGENSALQRPSYFVNNNLLKWFVLGSDDKAINLDLDLDDLLVRGCKWLHGYLKTNPNVNEADRALCDDILQ